jgi:hypothetical protein
VDASLAHDSQGLWHDQPLPWAAANLCLYPYEGVVNLTITAITLAVERMLSLPVGCVASTISLQRLRSMYEHIYSPTGNAAVQHTEHLHPNEIVR